MTRHQSSDSDLLTLLSWFSRQTSQFALSFFLSCDALKGSVELQRTGVQSRLLHWQPQADLVQVLVLVRADKVSFRNTVFLSNNNIFLCCRAYRDVLASPVALLPPVDRGGPVYLQHSG